MPDVYNALKPLHTLSIQKTYSNALYILQISKYTQKSHPSRVFPELKGAAATPAEVVVAEACPEPVGVAPLLVVADSLVRFSRKNVAATG